MWAPGRRYSASPGTAEPEPAPGGTEKAQGRAGTGDEQTLTGPVEEGRFHVRPGAQPRIQKAPADRQRRGEPVLRREQEDYAVR